MNLLVFFGKTMGRESPMNSHNPSRAHGVHVLKFVPSMFAVCVSSGEFCDAKLASVEPHTQHKESAHCHCSVHSNSIQSATPTIREFVLVGAAVVPTWLPRCQQHPRLNGTHARTHTFHLHKYAGDAWTRGRASSTRDVPDVLKYGTKKPPPTSSPESTAQNKKSLFNHVIYLHQTTENIAVAAPTHEQWDTIAGAASYYLHLAYARHVYTHNYVVRERAQPLD